MGTRERIIDAALQMFNENGERAVTTNHIASKLGISPGNLYYHFRNKQAIIANLFDRYEQRVLDSGTPRRTRDRNSGQATLPDGRL